jgi:glucuronosyltransferase
MLIQRLTLVMLLTGSFYVTNAYKILCLFPHVAKSHFIMAEALMKGLAAKGHQVTMISNFPQKTPIPNYRDISLVGSMPDFVSQVPVDLVATGHVHTTIGMLAYMAYVNCENTMEFPAMKKFIAANEKFDLIITELFNTDCFLGYVYKQNTPFIALSTSVMMPWAHARFGNPDNPSYMGNHFLYHGYKMTFTERLINALYEEGLKLVYKFMFEKPAYELAKKYFGESLPPLSEIAKNTSLLLVNSHFSLNQPRPLVPNIVEVGGIHLKPPEYKLTKVSDIHNAWL